MEQTANSGDGQSQLGDVISVSGMFEDITAARQQARSFLTEVQLLHGLPVSERTMDVVQLVVSELVTNARKYAPGPCLLTLDAGEGAVEVTVWDKPDTAGDPGTGPHPDRPARTGDRHGSRPQLRHPPRTRRQTDHRHHRPGRRSRRQRHRTPAITPQTDHHSRRTRQGTGTNGRMGSRRRRRVRPAVEEASGGGRRRGRSPAPGPVQEIGRGRTGHTADPQARRRRCARRRPGRVTWPHERSGARRGGSVRPHSHPAMGSLRVTAPSHSADRRRDAHGGNGSGPARKPGG